MKPAEIHWRATRAAAALGALATSLMLLSAAVPRALGASEKEPVLGGLDPVLLMEGKEVAGDPLLVVDHDGLLYRFDSDRTRRVFAEDPGRYAVQLGGSCARMGPGVEGQPDLFAIALDRVWLFGTEQCRDAFLDHPERYVLPPLPALEPTAEDRRAARELLEKAAGSLSKRPLRRLPGYRVVGSIERGQQGSAFELWLTLDGGVLRKRMLGVDTAVEVWDGGSGASSDRAGRERLSEPRRLELVAEGARFDALAVLRAVDLDALSVTVEDPERPGPTRLVRLQVAPPGASRSSAEAAPDQIVLEIDRFSGRTSSMRFRGRGPGGRAGWITRRFDDFRPTGDLFLPFLREDTFEGWERPFQVTRIERVEAEKLDAQRVVRELLEPHPGGR